MIVWKEILELKEKEYDGFKLDLKKTSKIDCSGDEKKLKIIRIEYELKLIADEINKIEKHLKRLEYIKKVRII